MFFEELQTGLAVNLQFGTGRRGAKKLHALGAVEVHALQQLVVAGHPHKVSPLD